MTEVLAVYCNVCDTTVYSRAGHDYHHCLCTNEDYALMVDGGPGTEYVRFGWGNLAEKPKSFVLKIKASEQDLYDDWNHGRNKYGYIKGNAQIKAKVQKRRKSRSKV